MLAAEGYQSLVNMDGGMHGKSDPLGRPVPGWIACGFSVEKTSDRARTWQALRAPIPG